MTQTAKDSMTDFLRHMDLRPTDYDRFRGDVEQEEGRLFGGLVLAQSVIAAGRTVERGDIHSLHAYFLRAGQPVEPIDYIIERVRQGRNFFTRRVTALQAGHTIFEASVSFTLSEEGLSHQVPMPSVPDPEGQPSWWEMMQAKMPPALRKQMNRRSGRRGWPMPIDIRGVSAGPLPGEEGVLPQRTVWARPVGALPEDPLIHAAAMAYMSDSGLVATVASFHMFAPGATSASLDHAMWFHYPPRFDDWLLYVNESPAAHAARALIHGRMYRRDGKLVASVAQEGLFRAGHSQGEPPSPTENR